MLSIKTRPTQSTAEKVLYAAVTSKGQVTLPIALRKQLGIALGSQIGFVIKANTVELRPELPMSASFGILKHLNLPADFATIPKEQDKWAEALQAELQVKALSKT
jgi:AbrB family looped-hinge helix DNA binding protein